MVLAGVLLKLGGYGLIKIIKLIPSIHVKVINFFIRLNIWGALLVGLICLSATDIKIIIAYSSIIHINLMVVGLLTKRSVGLVGGILIIISHGFSSPGIFALANSNYEKSQSRNILLHKGIGFIQPTNNLF